jgi:hypothetical protein
MVASFLYIYALGSILNIEVCLKSKLPTFNIGPFLIVTRKYVMFILYE